MDIPSLTIDAIREGLLARRFSATDLATEALRFAEAGNAQTNAYLHFSPERALETAHRVDRQIAHSEDPGPLAGVPVAVKDVIVWIEAAGRLHPALRRHGDRPHRRSRRTGHRQDQLRRVRHGIVH